MCLHARHAAAQTLNRNGATNYYCKTHIKLDPMLERRVREAWSVQDAILITSIYASHASACSPRCGANPKPQRSRQLPLQNTYQTRPRAQTARAWRSSRSVSHISYKHLCASSGSMLERRVRGVRLENLPAISLAKNIKLDLVLEPRVRGARPHPYFILFTSIYASPIVASANGIGLPRIPDPRRPPAARASPRTNLRCETLRLDLPRALA